MSQPAPRVSVGMPVRNGERFIRQAIDSILSQTFKDFELIICDNASTDSTESICRQSARLDPRVRYFRNKRDVGPAENYNICFRRARGEYFKWAAHDDICLPTYLEKCVAALDADGSVVNCHSKTRVIDENGNWVCDYGFETDSAASAPHRRFGRLINVSHRRHAGYEIFGVMRRAVMATVPEQGAYAHADRVFLVRMSLRGKFHEIDEYLFLARRHASQSMAARRTTGLRRMLGRFIGVGPLPPPEWWDAASAERTVFPDWRLLKEYHRSVSDARLSRMERLRCEMWLGLWVVRYWPKLARDVLFATERLCTQDRSGRHREFTDEDAEAGVSEHTA